MKFYILAIVFFIGLTFSTCSYDLSTPDVCFQEDVLPIFVSNCTMANCHNSTNGEAFDLTTYDGIMNGVTPKHPLFSEVYTSISGSNPSMPRSPYPKLTAKQVNYIKVWIKMGAKNSSNCSNCDTTNFSYSGKIRPLFDNWCIGCHSSNNPGGGFNLTTYSGVLATITNNKLLPALDHTGPYPMPKDNKLSACDLKAVKNWLNAGHLNN